ncbi:hypothetical protein Pint_25794 [Pistacia integerrima]|uniref:Uncharacterized protein n=1 Tax=Pistacia integerrima TaxID=434235 RepID=A0ACC0YF51_9ROSI|nr:hypothetical protein Pint_25794 [Pistacia integerrima]
MSAKTLQAVFEATDGCGVVGEKDRRIRELSSELHRANQQLAACREQLRMFMSYIEEHTKCLSKTVEGAVHDIKEVESHEPNLHS